jgi:hypothetical protein
MLEHIGQDASAKDVQISKRRLFQRHRYKYIFWGGGHWGRKRLLELSDQGKLIVNSANIDIIT